MNKIKSFIIELRAPFLTVTIIPVIIGTALAHRQGLVLNIGYFWIVLAAFIFLHLGTNVLNDYFDNENGTDKVNKNFIPPFTGGSRLIQSGILKPSAVLVQGIGLFVLGTVLFIPLIMKFGLPMAGVLAFSLIAGIFYTAPPFKWAHLGLGEFLIFVSFGPLMAYTAYVVQGGPNLLIPVISSLTAGFLASAIVDINQFPDFDADKKTGKKNLVVRLGIKNGRITYLIITTLAYVGVAVAVIFKTVPLAAAACFITLPLAINAVVMLYKNYDKPKNLTPACGITIVNHLLTGLILICVLYFVK